MSACYPDGRLRRGNAMFGAQYVDAQGARGCRLATWRAFLPCATFRRIGGNAAQLAAQAVKLQVWKHSGALLRPQPKHDGPTHAPLMAEAIRNTVFKAARREGSGGSGSG
ncbi:hypothetical protein PLESTM_000621800 [Pleodorina starrii]|nr:hypothetical protein PLESTM_000621800 [Pleodorina starrii]